jgi:hypothetical protein
MSGRDYLAEALITSTHGNPMDEARQHRASMLALLSIATDLRRLVEQLVLAEDPGYDDALDDERPLTFGEQARAAAREYAAEVAADMDIPLDENALARSARPAGLTDQTNNQEKS